MQCISLSQQVDLHSLLDFICSSISKIFQSKFKLLDHTCRLTCNPSVNFTLVELHGIQIKKSAVNNNKIDKIDIDKEI